MAKRIKKPLVIPEKRREWYKRSEEEGESALQIAKADKYDVRTVRKQIDIEKQEREVREARSVVLRSALEAHYRDLCRFAEVLKENISGIKTMVVDSAEVRMGVDSHLKAALREHMPRSPIWNYLDQRGNLSQRINQLYQEANNKIDGIKSDPKLQGFGDRLPAVVYGLTTFYNFQFERWSKGSTGLDLKEHRVELPLEDGFFEFGYGSFRMGKVRKEEILLIDEMAEDWQSRVKAFEELDKLKKTFDDLSRIDNKLIDELAVITLRRVVPGRCRYCPI